MLGDILENLRKTMKILSRITIFKWNLNRAPPKSESTVIYLLSVDKFRYIKQVNTSQNNNTN